MDTKKMIIALIVLIIIVATIILIAFRIKKADEANIHKNGYEDVYVKKEDNKDNKKIDSKYTSNVINKYYNDLDEEGRTTIDKEIDKVIELINKKKAPELYSMLAPSYKNAKFYRVDLLQDFLIRELPEEDYSSSGYRLLDSHVMYFSLVDSKGKFVREIRLSYYNDKNIDTVVYLDPVTSISKNKFFIRKEDYSIGGNYILRFGDYISYVVNVNNFSDSTMNFDFANTSLHCEKGYVTNVSELLGGYNTKVTVGAHSDAIIELTFEPPRGTAKSLNLVYKYEGEEFEEFCPIIDENDDI